jgi:hypothetical protein
LPFNRFRREAYHYKEQSPSDHIENLNRYLQIAPSIIPSDTALSHFRIRHPNLRTKDIIVSRSPESNLQIVSLIDWQYVSILPLFLLGYIPEQLHSYEDPVSLSMIPPSLPDIDDLNEIDRKREKERYHRRLLHYHYLKNTVEYNVPHVAALEVPFHLLRRSLFCYSSDGWKGETLPLKLALMAAVQNWVTLRGGRDLPCPVKFDLEDVSKTLEQNEVLAQAYSLQEMIQELLGVEEQGWVSDDRYEDVMELNKQMKKDIEEGKQMYAGWWIFDDIDEEKYM